MRVTGSNVLVKKITDRVSSCGVFIPDFVNTGYCYCEVVAVGEGAYHMPTDKIIPLQVKVGDRTLVNPGVMEEYHFYKNGTRETYYCVPAVECTMILADNEDI